MIRSTKDPPEDLTDEEKLLWEIFGPLADGCLVSRAGGWTIEPFKHGGSFAVTPPVVPQTEELEKLCEGGD